MNKRQREKLFKKGNCFKVISKYPQRHHFLSGEIVWSVSKWGEYLNCDKSDHVYILDDEGETESFRTQFTQKEIDAMPFDVEFFKQVKVEA